MLGYCPFLTSPISGAGCEQPTKSTQNIYMIFLLNFKTFSPFKQLLIFLVKLIIKQNDIIMGDIDKLVILLKINCIARLVSQSS